MSTYRVTYPNGYAYEVQASDPELAIIRANRMVDWRRRRACSGRVELVTGKKGKTK